MNSPDLIPPEIPAKTSRDSGNTGEVAGVGGVNFIFKSCRII